jgi:signal transduction histidine kinase
MELRRRSVLIYGLLLAAWVLILGWQVTEHFRVRRAARAELILRAKDISTTLGIVLRSQRRFGGVVSKERLESALADLVRPGELSGIALLNAAGDVVASAGARPDFQAKAIDGPSERWDEQRVTLMNLVDLGATVTRDIEHDIERTNPPVILSREDFFRPPDPNRPPPPFTESAPSENPTNANGGTPATNPPPAWPRPRGGEGRPRFGRPGGMSDEESQAMLQKQGVHSFLIVMSTQSVRAASNQDLWLRSIIAVLATVSVVGFGLAWSSLGKSSDLQIRLVRTSELNTHLKEMNLAAAGLAHETRNPLNIIRGMAQMISKLPDAPAEIRDKSRAIVDETDKVTAQLNEFINYSRPREVRRTVLALGSAINEVVRALNYDIEEKKVQLEVKGEPLSIEADEQLLRQTLFNLLLNAIQAIDVGGKIQIVAEKRDASEAVLEIRDNGPGVPLELRQEIFKPYVTTQEKGTGLGLAVVQQIVLAHGWEIECLSNQPKGAIFRLTHLKLVART